MTSSTDTARPTVSLRAKLMAAAMALVLSFGLCELMARAMFPAPQEFREPRIVYQFQPEGGFIHLPNQKAWMDEGFVTVNSLGLRGPEPVVPKPADLLRVLALGDSTTFGLGVNDDETYVASLDARLKRDRPRPEAEAVNGGISGLNLTLETILFRRFAPVLRPDVVLIGLFWNDLPYEAVSPEGVPLQVASSSPTAATTAAPPPAAPKNGTFRIGEPPSRLNRTLRSSRLLYVARQKWLGFLSPTAQAANEVAWETALLDGKKTPAIDGAWESVRAELAGMRDIGASAGIDVGVVVMPIRAQVERDYPAAAYQTRAVAMAESLGMFAIDPLPRFRRETDRSGLFIPYDRMHYSARGNAVLADAVFEALGARPAFVRH